MIRTLVLVVFTSLAAGCAAPAAVVDPRAADAAVVAPSDDAPVAWSADEVVVAGIHFPEIHLPRIGAAAGRDGATLLAWIERTGSGASALVVSIDRGGGRRREVISGEARVYDGEVVSGFTEDGAAVVAHEGGLVPQFASSYVLAPGAEAWRDAGAISSRGAACVSLDTADASRAAIAGSGRTAHWEKLGNLRTWLPSVCPDPLVTDETTLAVADLAGDEWRVADFGVHHWTRQVARADGVLAAAIDVRDGADRIVAIDVASGAETVLAETEGATEVVAVTTGARTFVAWTDRGGVVFRERPADGSEDWSPPARIPGSTWGALRAASGPGWLLVTTSAGAEVHAWLRRGDAWSRNRAFPGWAGAPVSHRGRPVVYRVVGEPQDALGAARGRVPSPPAAGSIVRTAATW